MFARSAIAQAFEFRQNLRMIRGEAQRGLEVLACGIDATPRGEDLRETEPGLQVVRPKSECLCEGAFRFIKKPETGQHAPEIVVRLRLLRVEADSRFGCDARSVEFARGEVGGAEIGVQGGGFRCPAQALFVSRDRFAQPAADRKGLREIWRGPPSNRDSHAEPPETR